MQLPAIFYDLIILLYVFHSIIIFCHVFFTPFFHMFFCLKQPFYMVCSTAFSRFLVSPFISSYSRNIFFTETNFSWLIHEWIKAFEIKTAIEFYLVFANNTTWLFYVIFFDNGFILFNLCSNCTNFYFYCRTHNT